MALTRLKSFDHLSTNITSAPRKEPAPRHVSQETTIIYASLNNLDAYLKKAGTWNWFKEGNNTVIEFKESEYLIAKFSVRVESTLKQARSWLSISGGGTAERM